MLKYFACKPGKYAIDKTELCRQMMIHRPRVDKSHDQCVAVGQDTLASLICPRIRMLSAQSATM